MSADESVSAFGVTCVHVHGVGLNRKVSVNVAAWPPVRAYLGLGRLGKPARDDFAQHRGSQMQGW